jgi:hypothetical protein
MRHARGVHLQAIGKLSPHCRSPVFFDGFNLSLLSLGKTVPRRLRPVILGSLYGTAVEAAKTPRESRRDG